MSEDFSKIRIRQLPEAANIQPDDYVIVDNDHDTWKAKVSLLDQYIKDKVNILGNTITDSVDNKVTEVQILLTQTTEIVNNITNQITQIEASESAREEAEQQREQNEAIRENTFSEMQNTITECEENEDNRKQQETDRVNAETNREQQETDRVNAETNREQQETDRVNAETNRASAETDRREKEEERQVAETNRENAEKDRTSIFKQMTDYFAALSESVDNFAKEGESQEVTSESNIVEIVEAVVPADATNDFCAVLHIHELSTSIDSFLAVSIPIANPSLYIFIPEMYQFKVRHSEEEPIYTIEEASLKLNATVNTVDNAKVITIQYKASYDGVKVRTSILWDNISAHNPTDVAIYSRASKNQAPVSNFSMNGAIDSVVNDYDTVAYNLAIEFINLIDNIDTHIKNVADTMEPYKLYPIGSIYKTTSQENPEVILGGGLWEPLYGGLGISEGIENDDGDELYSPIIYYWERKE